MSSLSASSTKRPPDRMAPLLRGAAIPALIAGAAVTLGAGVLAGGRGVAGALLGLAVVLLFSGTGMLILRSVRNQDPMITMIVGLGSYTLRVVLFGIAIMILGSLNTESWLHRGSFVVAVLVCVAAWIGGEIRAFQRLRIPVYDLDEQQEQPEQPRPDTGEEQR